MVAPDNLMESPKERTATKGTNIPQSQTSRNEQTTDDDKTVTEEVHKQPSYVALACCISGYTTLSYDSKQRQSLRSRPVSPIRPESIQNVMYTTECGRYLLPESAKVNQNMQTEGKGIDLLNGCGGLHSPRHVANISIAQESKSFSSSMVSESYAYNSSRFIRTTANSSSSLTTTVTNGDSSASRLITPTKLTEQLSPSSFIVQRVERLYGPGALAQGFYTPPRVKNVIKPTTPKDVVQQSTTDGENCEQSLPVLKLLRPEFRAQLTVASRKLRTTSIPEKLSSSPFEEIKPQEKRKNSSDQIDASIVVNNRAVDIPQIVIKDGYYFLNILKENVDRLENFAEDAEKELTTLENEEGCGILRAAAGKARLLVAQKLKQFEGLCVKNIKQSKDEDFPTTNEDLAGFWDMVMIQITEVFNLFEEINQLRKNSWKNIEASELNNRTASNLQTPNKIHTQRKANINKKPPGGEINTTNSAAAKARDEARRKMIEERRKAMRESKQSHGSASAANGTTETMFVL